MCGIAGFLNLSKTNFKADENLLNLMQQKLQHRGPDSFGIWKSDEHQIGLTHRRLSIIDLSSLAAQPMLDREKTVAICFNGEIYNHLELRSELESLGYKYFSNSDTETLIYAYKEWGMNFLHRLDGMFAISIFDLQKKELYLVRDRIGVKPLYYSNQGGVLSFASEIKALWMLPWNYKNINNESLYHYLTFMVTPAPDTIFDKVLKLPAGFYLKVGANKKIEIQEWYSPLNVFEKTLDQKELSDENFCLEKIESLLTQSIEKRMMSDVPVGAFLSGGVDSSLNVALMSQLNKKVKTFTVAFSDEFESNELRWARFVAKKFGTDHHEIIISEKEAFDFYQNMVYHLDEPLADCVCIPFYHVAKLAKDCGVTVAQVGEGADELFFGYSTYATYKKFYDRFWHPAEKVVPNFMKKPLYNSYQKFFPKNSNHLEIFKNWSEKRDLFWGGAIAFNENQKKLILQNNKYDSFNIVNSHLSDLKKVKPDADFVTQMTYLELKQRLPELLLMRADKMAMAAGIEGRVPFLDYKLVEFMLTVPTKLKFKNNENKYLLKKVAEKFLPEGIIYRKKMGFGAPTYRWFNKGKYFPGYFKKVVETENKKNNLFLPAIKNLENVYNNHKFGFAVQKWTLQNVLTLK